MAPVARRGPGALLLAGAAALALYNLPASFVSGNSPALPRAGSAALSTCRSPAVDRSAGAIVQAPGDIKNGLKLIIDGQPYQILSFMSKKLGKGVGITKCKVRHLITGATVDKNLQSGTKCDAIDTEWKDATYSYYSEDSNRYVFMDLETFEEMELPGEALDGNEDWLTDGITVDIETYNDDSKVHYINFRFKGDIIAEVVKASDSNRQDGDQQVELDNGAIKSAPGYIKVGDKVLIDAKNFNIKKRV